MNFLEINYNLNQTYQIEDKALLQMIKEAIKEVKGVELLNSNIEINKKSTSYKVSVEVGVKPKYSISQSALSIQNAIEDKSKTLTSFKPENIEVIFKEVK